VFFVDLVAALFFGLLLTIIFTGGVRRDLWANFFFFFLVVFLAAWAGGVWIGPVGPPFWGIYWVSFLIVGLFFALILAASMGPGHPRTQRGSAGRVPEPVMGKEESKKAADIFFWILIGALFLAILAHYARV
jgi:hypothetical protein